MWNGTGMFKRIYEWANQGVKLNAQRLDEEFINYKLGLEHCLTRNGETIPTDDLNMQHFKHVNVGKPDCRNQYATAGEVQDQSYNYVGRSTGSMNKYKVKLPFDQQELTAGQIIYFTAHQSNQGPAKIKIAKSDDYKEILKRATRSLVAGDILENMMIMLIYDGKNFQILSTLEDPKIDFPDQIKPIQNQLVPTGSVMAFSGPIIPEGWVEAHGQVINSLDQPNYAELFKVIGVTYGGTGAEAFHLPDLRGRTIYGQDNMGNIPANRVNLNRGGIEASKIGASGGSAVHCLTLDEIPSHTHLSMSKNAGMGTGASISGKYQLDSESGAAGGGQSHNNMPPILVLKWMIKL